MNITAPVEWLDHICRDLILEEAINDGWEPEGDSDWYTHKDYRTHCIEPIAIPDTSFADYRTRILEAIGGMVAVKGITVAEWFMANLFRHASHKIELLDNLAAMALNDLSGPVD